MNTSKDKREQKVHNKQFGKYSNGVSSGAFPLLLTLDFHFVNSEFWCSPVINVNWLFQAKRWYMRHFKCFYQLFFYKTETQNLLEEIPHKNDHSSADRRSYSINRQTWPYLKARRKTDHYLISAKLRKIPLRDFKRSSRSRWELRSSGSLHSE
jgi:hypothetical protein